MESHRIARNLQSQGRERGSSIIEFALLLPTLVLMFFGSVLVASSLGRGIQATQVVRDIGHMYALGVDFSQVQNRNVALNLAPQFDLTANGNGVIILSQVMRVYSADCQAAGLGATCPNVNKTVFTNRIVIGNSSVRTSEFGMPPSNYVNPQGNIASSDYLQQSSLVANGFDNIMTLNQGQIAWVAEGGFTSAGLAALSAAGYNGDLYARIIF